MKQPAWLGQIIKHLNFSASESRGLEFQRVAHTFAASPVSERNVAQGIDWNGVYRDRYNYDREQIYEQALIAWRLNPLARRIIEIQKQYVIDAIEFHCDDEATQKFLQEFWNHPLNKIGEHLAEWSDELALTGNLFPIITTDRAGMSYLRIYPTDMIADIETRRNDVQQELAYMPKATQADQDPTHILNYWSYADRKPKSVMLHFAVNKLAGMKWGEPDIAPLLPWLARYASWLEDRVRLNRFRQAFLYVVRGKYDSEAQKAQRQNELTANPPAPGSILVTDQSEDWGILNPQLDSFEANTDGLALKKFIAGGRGFPLHWLAEPESSTRTTAEAAGTPTFKNLASRQMMFLSMLKELLTIVVKRRAQTMQDVKADALITVTAADISERDNAALALASTHVITSFGQLWANGFIDADEYLRIVYRFSGEVLPDARPDNPAARKTPIKPNNTAPASDQITVDSKTGDVKIKEPK
jgi:hypothetical protein